MVDLALGLARLCLGDRPMTYVCGTEVSSHDTKLVTYESSSKRILFVDDNEHIRLLTEDFLKEFGYDVLSIADGLNFLPVIETFRPHLILLDLKMPHVDGFTLLAQLQQSDWSHIPTIVWSAHTFASAREKALQLGAACYLPKPLDPMKLLQSIQSHWPTLVSAAEATVAP